MAMFFYDEYEEMEEYRLFREQNQPLVLEYERLRRALQAAETARGESTKNRFSRTRPRAE